MEAEGADRALPDEWVRSNRRAWDVAAEKYADRIDDHVALLERGHTSLESVELRHLGDLSGCGRAVHLCCSHGLDALSLLNLGADEVVGVDVSAAMLEQARTKSERLGVPARWIQSDALELPEVALDLAGTADLVYTGKGALPWLSDIRRWSEVVAWLLRPGGRLYVFEGHPLDVVWEHRATEYVLRADADYFASEPRPNDGFPESAVTRHWSGPGPAPTAVEFHHTLGEVVTAVADAGLHIELLEEIPRPFWDRFPDMEPDRLGRLPHAFGLLARATLSESGAHT